MDSDDAEDDEERETCKDEDEYDKHEFHMVEGSRWILFKGTFEEGNKKIFVNLEEPFRSFHNLQLVNPLNNLGNPFNKE